MATTVYTTEDVVLQDGTEVTLRPNSIRQQRKFMDALEGGTAPKNNAEATDWMVALAKICLTKALPELVEDDEAFEDALDEPTIYKVIEICGGIKLDDPNLVAAAAATMMDQNQDDGQN